MLALDNTYRLEAMRKEIEDEYAYYNDDKRKTTKQVAKAVF